jgi:hypothetical protein
VRSYDKRGTAEQWIKEGKQATHWTRPSCHRFRTNEARLQWSLLAHNLGNLWRRVVLLKRISAWSLTSLRQRLVKTGGRLIKHARYYWLLLAEGHLHGRLFGQMLRRIYLCAAGAERVALRLRLQNRGRVSRVGAVSEKSIMRRQAGLVRQAKTSLRTPADLAGACSRGKFVVCKAGEAYDVRARGPNRKFRSTCRRF